MIKRFILCYIVYTLLILSGLYSNLNQTFNDASLFVAFLAVQVVYVGIFSGSLMVDKISFIGRDAHYFNWHWIFIWFLVFITCICMVSAAGIDFLVQSKEATLGMHWVIFWSYCITWLLSLLDTP